MYDFNAMRTGWCAVTTHFLNARFRIQKDA